MRFWLTILEESLLRLYHTSSDSSTAMLPLHKSCADLDEEDLVIFSIAISVTSGLSQNVTDFFPVLLSISVDLEAVNVSKLSTTEYSNRDEGSSPGKHYSRLPSNSVIVDV